MIWFLRSKIMLGIWAAMAIIFSIQAIVTHRYNNYLIFKHTIFHFIKQLDLYASYPLEYGDVLHYGPVFAFFVAPFAVMPDWLGLTVWNLFNTLILFYAISTLPISDLNKNIIRFLAIPVLIASLLSEQFNATAGALMILSFTKLNVKKGIWSAFFIMSGAFIKLYGIVGLCFFFLSKYKKHWVGFLILFGMVMLLFPLLFTNANYLQSCYQSWFTELLYKNDKNISSLVGINLSVMGLIGSLLGGVPNVVNYYILLGGIFTMGLASLVYYKKQLNQSTAYSLLLLAAVLLFTVLFSTGAEDCTYIISVTGFGIWFITEQNKKLKITITIVYFICTSTLLKAVGANFGEQTEGLLTNMYILPFFLVWLRIIMKIFQGYFTGGNTALQSVSL